MVHWLYYLSDIQVVLLFASFIVTAVVLVPRQLRRMARMKPDNDAADCTVRASATLITTCIFVLGFSLLQTQSAFNKVDQQVTSEASSINQLDRLLVRYGDPKLFQSIGKSSSS